MDREAAQALVAAFSEFENSNTKVAVVWGAGGGFCAGWHLKWAATLTDPDLREAYFRDHGFGVGAAPVGPGARGSSRKELSKSVIGAIEGAAVPGGVELAL